MPDPYAALIRSQVYAFGSAGRSGAASSMIMDSS